MTTITWRFTIIMQSRTAEIMTYTKEDTARAMSLIMAIMDDVAAHDEKALEQAGFDFVEERVIVMATSIQNE